MCDFLPPHDLYSPWDSPGQNTGVGGLSLLQGIFPTQRLNPIDCIAGGFFTSWATREAGVGSLSLLQRIFPTQHSRLNQLSYQGSPKWKWKSLSCVWFFATPWTAHGILQARILEWVAFPFSRGSSQPRNQTGSPALQVDSLPTELSGKPSNHSFINMLNFPVTYIFWLKTFFFLNLFVFINES